MRVIGREELFPILRVVSDSRRSVNVNADDMTTAAALLDIFPLDVLISKPIIKRIVEEPLGMAVCLVRDEIHVVTAGRVLDRLDSVTLE